MPCPSTGHKNFGKTKKLIAFSPRNVVPAQKLNLLVSHKHFETDTTYKSIFGLAQNIGTSDWETSPKY
jgi:hypothetical protein